ncbi:MAG: hypothetical protein ACU0BB_16030 [Paracoccaceae bacterium]
MKEHFSEIQRQILHTSEAFESISSASDAKELRDAWEDFLLCFHRAIGRIISVAKKDAAARGWGYKLQNASSKDDEGLVFLREARAQIEHGLEPFADFKDPNVDVGGLISLGGSSSATLKGNMINGKPMGDMQITTKGGRISSLVGQPNVQIREMPTEIFFQPIHSEIKRKSYPVPSSIRGRDIKANDPRNIAEVSLGVLSDLFEELKRCLA